ncbi:hypothetical protein II906_08560, partial [bacterium]|nr:hypothetical protein [bacterium]
EEIIIRVYFEMADLADKNMNAQAALSYIKMAIEIAKKINNIPLLAHSYYKYALIFDDLDNIDYATKFYLRCVQTSNNPSENKYISAAYANLADISLDSNNYAAAKMYYELAIEADKQLNNIDGLYYSYMKLSEVYETEDINKQYEMLINALNIAKKFDEMDNFVTTYIAIGDYFAMKEDYKQAIKSYIMAKSLSPNSNEDIYGNNIDDKLAEIKGLIGNTSFNTFVDEIKKKR